MKPSGVIFDFDGVVVDSLGVHLRAWSEAYENLYGLKLLDTTGLPGRSTGAIADILSNRAGRQETASQLADEKRNLLKQSHLKVEAFPGALEAFKWLRTHHLPFGIASNAPRAFILSTLNSLHAQVDVVFGVDDVARPKPYPDMFLQCAKKLNIHFTDHPQTIVFEDSLHGLQAAVTAGMFPIGISTQHDERELFNGGAKLVFANIADAMAGGAFEDL